MSKRLAIFYIDASGGQYTLERGKIIVPKGKVLGGIRIRQTAFIKNTSGAPISLNSTDRSNIIKNAINSFTLHYGLEDEGSSRTPFISVDGMQLRRHQRVITGIDLNGYADATTGLARAIANGGADVAVRFTTILPFQAPWWFKRAKKSDFAMGRHQARTITFDLKRGAADPVLQANLAVGANKWVYELYPVLVDSNVDVYNDVPHYLEKDEDGQTTRGPDGLHFLIADRNAAAVATAYTQYNLAIGEQVIHQELDPVIEREMQLDQYNFLASADVGDDVTPLYRPDVRTDMQRLPMGRPFFEQPKDDYTTTKLVYFFVPPMTYEYALAITGHLATGVARRPLKTISLPSFNGEAVPDGFQAFAGMAVVDQTDGTFHTSVGLVAQPGSPVIPHVPSGKAISLKNAAEMIKANHDPAAIAPALAKIQRGIASALPGGLKHATGPGLLAQVHPAAGNLLSAMGIRV